jgi:hypothetical protein
MTQPTSFDKYQELKDSYPHLPFNKYQSDFYSQNGEDGVIWEILHRLQLLGPDNWCVEFGAWDGRHLSNTFSLVEKNFFKAVYIEGHAKRYLDLLSTVDLYPQIVPLLAYVGRVADDDLCLDKLLARTEIPSSFALLSIDVDSYDLDIFESLQCYSPKVVVIEINSSVPPGIIWRHGNGRQGNTFTATCNVAQNKGYTLVCHTGNLIFVRNDLIVELNIDNRFITYPELLFLFNWIPQRSYQLRKGFEFHKFASQLLPGPIRSLLKKLLKIS